MPKEARTDIEVGLRSDTLCPVTKPQVTVLGPRHGATVNLDQPFPVAGEVTNQFVSGEPVMIDSVTIRVDGGPVIKARLSVVPDKTHAKVNFATSAQVTGGEDPHAVAVTASNDQGASTTQTVFVLTLGDVVDFYNTRFRIGLSQQEKKDLIAFLSSL